MSREAVRGLVFDIQRFSIHDGPGIRTLVFLKGCLLRCLWCSNPESQGREPELLFFPVKCIGCNRCREVCPTGAAGESDPFRRRELCSNCCRCVEVCPSEARRRAGTWMSVREVLDRVKRDREFYLRSGGGVTLTGGEPLVQKEFTAAFLARCREAGLHTAIETCGLAPVDVFEAVTQDADLVLFDLKHMDAEKHREQTGVPNELILENARRLRRRKKAMVLRVPVVPGYNDTAQNMEEASAFAGKLGVEEIDLMPYHRLGEAKYAALNREFLLPGVQRLDRDDPRLLELKERLEARGFRVGIGG